MNNYITLDSKKYLCPWPDFRPVVLKPSTIRFALSGSTDVTYGPSVPKQWQGPIIGPVSAASGWGTITDLRTSLAKQQGLSFTDHYGTSYTVHAIGPFPEMSKGPKWDSPSNEIWVNVLLVAQ